MASRNPTHEDRWAGYEEGKCRWCKEDVKRFDSRRRTFCSDECVREYRIRFDWSYARKEVYKRDKGCCQLCGLDCSKFFRKLKEAMKAFPKRERENRSKSFFLMNNVRYVKWTHRSTFWDVDHIVAWSQGGNFCGLNNLRLLCISCHQDETIRLIQRKKDAVNDPDPTRFL